MQDFGHILRLDEEQMAWGRAHQRLSLEAGTASSVCSSVHPGDAGRASVDSGAAAASGALLQVDAAAGAGAAGGAAVAAGAADVDGLLLQELQQDQGDASVHPAKGRAAQGPHGAPPHHHHQHHHRSPGVAIGCGGALGQALARLIGLGKGRGRGKGAVLAARGPGAPWPGPAAAQQYPGTSAMGALGTTSNLDALMGQAGNSQYGYARAGTGGTASLNLPPGSALSTGNILASSQVRQGVGSAWLGGR